mgnify:CR=1 FL=1
MIIAIQHKYSGHSLITRGKLESKTNHLVRINFWNEERVIVADKICGVRVP